MKLGILSDTHGDAGRTRTAMELLLENGVAAICHCGDIGSASVLETMAAACAPGKIPVYAVLGNVDHWEPEVREFTRSTGIRICGQKAEIELAGRKIAVVHGDDPRLLFHTVRSGEHDYCLTGHTHHSDDFVEGRTRVINPGAVYRSPTPSVAVLDLERDVLEILWLR